MERHQFSERERALIECAPVPLAIYQFLGRRVVVLAVSQGFVDTFGLGTHADAMRLMDTDMYRDAHPDDVARIAEAAVRFATEGGTYEVVYRSKAPGAADYAIVHSFGRHIWTRDGLRLAVVWYADEGFVSAPSGKDGLARTLSEALSAVVDEEALSHESNYDTLTGLPSMGYYMELAEAARGALEERGETGATLYFDLNGIKRFNRSHGFTEGNRLLRAVARILATHFTNESCARFGSDHFCVYTQDIDLSSRVASVVHEIEHANGDRSLPVRVGIYRDAFERVDVGVAADRAKSACDVFRGTFVSTVVPYDEALQSTNATRSYLLEHFNQALSEGWVRPWYQPVVRARDGALVHAEALARWIDPERGVIAPDEFIPILEQARLIGRLDLAIVEQVLRDVCAAQAAGASVVPVSVNLSRIDFDGHDMVGELCRLADAYGVDHRMIVVEITESAVGRDFAFVQNQVARFRALGFPTWMDDFGSGYSSLEVLAGIDFDALKFDMGFTRRLEGSDKSRVMLGELMRMARNLGMQTVAEGVETARQADFLGGIGCEMLQGYHFARPMPADEALAYCKEHAAGTGSSVPCAQDL